MIDALRALHRRLRQQDAIDDLTRIQADLLSSIKRQVTDRHASNTLCAAAWEWLQARIAYNAAKGHDEAVATEDRAIAATAALERATRAAFMSPGVRGSWGRGAARDWACDFDPVGKDGLHGCECAGCGYTEAECRDCDYRTRIATAGVRR